MLSVTCNPSLPKIAANSLSEKQSLCRHWPSGVVLRQDADALPRRRRLMLKRRPESRQLPWSLALPWLRTVHQTLDCVWNCHEWSGIESSQWIPTRSAERFCTNAKAVVASTFTGTIRTTTAGLRSSIDHGITRQQIGAGGIGGPRTVSRDSTVVTIGSPDSMILREANTKHARMTLCASVGIKCRTGMRQIRCLGPPRGTTARQCTQ